jgi:hypothetical protein
MAGQRDIEDDQLRLLASLITTHDAYLLPDGSERWVATNPAWCPRCGAFVNVERLDDPDQLESQARAFYDDRQRRPMPALFEVLGAETCQQINDSVLRKLLHQAAQWRAALAIRTSPPRCLECGGTDHVAIAADCTWSEHPAERGRRVRVRPQHVHLSMAVCGRLYDTEGRRLAGRHASR